MSPWALGSRCLPGCACLSAPHDSHKALWFERCEDPVTGEQVHIYKGGYWEAKEQGSWEGCGDIF
ncbi:hypothetical protein CRUP_023651 [Coryphaenoides rupestris]|nr:hypothetical protein CRUP_023651 [Coryphaenoides rupestris]